MKTKTLVVGIVVCVAVVWMLQRRTEKPPENQSSTSTIAGAGPATSIAPAQSSPSAAPASATTSAIAAQAPTNAPLQLTVREIRTTDVGKDQLSQAFDAGDGFRTPSGRKSLLRLPGKVAVRTTQLGALTNAGGSLAGYALEAELMEGVVLLKATDDISLPKNAVDHNAKLKALRALPDVRTANPVFVDPETGYWLVNTEEIIVRVKPGVDPAKHFGADWARARRLPGTPDHFIVSLTTDRSEEVFSEVDKRGTNADLAFAEPNFIRQAFTQLTPNDSLYPQHWHHNNTGQSGGTAGADINAPQAWDTTTGGTNVIVAIHDIGTETTHPDLQPNLATNALEIGGNGIDDDGNGYVDDVSGWDFWANNNNPGPKTAFDQHGTAVAGVAVARGNNSFGVAGAAYTSKLLGLRIGNSSDASGSFSSSDAIQAAAIYYAAGRAADGSNTWRGADVLNFSISSGSSATLDAAYGWAGTNGRGGKGCVIFASAGNSAGAWRQYNLNGFPAGTYTFRWTYAKDGAGTVGDDAVWLDDVTFPGGTVERFEGSFPPSGWTNSGNAGWTQYTGSDHARGTGLRSARSGAIGDNQTSRLETARAVGAGTLTFWLWTSTQTNQDIVTMQALSGGSVIGSFTASGNPGVTTNAAYPGRHPQVICVGASTDFDYRSDYSQYGTNLSIIAPSGGGAGGIYTTDRTGANGYNTGAGAAGDYDTGFSGTSSASPLAAGVGALVLSMSTNLTRLQVKDILQGTADKIGGVTYTGGTNLFYGYGRVNAEKAVLAAKDTSNDFCGNAIVISTTRYTNTQTTLYATATGDPQPTCRPQPIGKPVWYRYTPPVSGWLQVDTIGSSFDTLLAIYTGACGSLTQVACDDDSGFVGSSSLIQMPVSAGTTYSILAGGYNGFSGTLVLRCNLFQPGTIQFSSASYSGTEDGGTATITATRTGGSDLAVNAQFTTANGTALAGADYTATNGTLSWGAGDSAPKNFAVRILTDGNVETNETVQLRLTSTAGSATTLGSLSNATLTIFDALTNDFCPAGLIIPATPFHFVQSTTGANGTNPIPPCVSTFGYGAWYNYTPAVNGRMTIATFGSNFDTVLGVYTGTCGSLVNVACHDDVNGAADRSSFIALQVTAGVTYRILAGGYGNTSGTLVLDVDFDPAGTFQFTASSFTAREDAGTAPITVSRVGGTGGAVSVAVIVAAGTATAGQDFTDGSALLNWGNGDSATKTVFVPLQNNSQLEVVETVALSLTSPSGGATLGAPNTATLNLLDVPTNDFCSNAVNVTSFPYTNRQSILEATSAGDPAPSCVFNSGHGVWYRYMPATNGQLFIHTEGSSFDTVISVYVGSCGALTPLSCDDDSGASTLSSNSIPLAAGSIYYILAGGYSVAAGDLTLTLNFKPAFPTLPPSLGAWSVREIYSHSTTPVNFATALTVAASPQNGTVIDYQSAVINRNDPESPGSAGNFFPNKEPFACNDRTPQGLLNGDDNHFVLVATCNIQIDQEDDYTFGFNGDDGARLRLIGGEFISSTAIGPNNPAVPPHSGDTLSFPANTGNSTTLGVAHLRPGIYLLEFMSWEVDGGAFCEVFSARGAKTSLTDDFRLVGSPPPSASGFVTHGAGTILAPGFDVTVIRDGAGTLTDAMTQVYGYWGGTSTPGNLTSVTEPIVHFADPESGGGWSFSGQFNTAPAGAALYGNAITLLGALHLTEALPGQNGNMIVSNFSGGNAIGSFTARFKVRLSDSTCCGGRPADGFSLSFATNLANGVIAGAEEGDGNGLRVTFDTWDNGGADTAPGIDVIYNGVTKATRSMGEPREIGRVPVTDIPHDPATGLPMTLTTGNNYAEVLVRLDADGTVDVWYKGVQVLEDVPTGYVPIAGRFSLAARTGSANETHYIDDLVIQAGAPTTWHGVAPVAFPGNLVGTDDDFIALGARAQLEITNAGDYSFLVLGDDGSRFRIKGSSGWTVSGIASALSSGFQVNGCCADAIGQVYLLPGIYEVELLFNEIAGGAYVGLWGAAGFHNVFDPEFRLLGRSPPVTELNNSTLTLVSTGGRPGNDDFASAFTINGTNVVIAGANAGATAEAGEATWPGAARSVWWNWTAPNSNPVWLDTFDSSFATRLGVFTGNTVSTLALISVGFDHPSHPPQSGIRFVPVAGQLYRIAVDGEGGAVGQIRLRLLNAPANDQFASATSLGNAMSAFTQGNNFGASVQGGEPNHAAPGGASVWWTWTAPSTGWATATTRGSSFDTLLAVYTGTLPALTLVAANDNSPSSEALIFAANSTVKFPATQGVTYSLAVDGRQANLGSGPVPGAGTVELTISMLPAITSITHTNGSGVTLQWPAQSLESYRVESSTNLVDWVLLESCQPSLNAVMTFTHTPAPPEPPQQFYRIVRE